jgi:hypothetical protein
MNDIKELVEKLGTYSYRLKNMIDKSTEEYQKSTNIDIYEVETICDMHNKVEELISLTEDLVWDMRSYNNTINDVEEERSGISDLSDIHLSLFPDSQQ